MTILATSPDRPTALTIGDLPARAWSTDVKIRFGECDPAGIVFTPRYLEIFNAVIEDWYDEALDLDYHDIIGARRIGLGYASLNSTFFRPSRMGDVLRVYVRVTRIGQRSFGLDVNAFREDAEALRTHFGVVTTDLDIHQPVAVPDDIRAALEAYRARTA